MFSRASQHVMLIQEPSKRQETLSHCSMGWISFASKHSILRFNDQLMLKDFVAWLSSVLSNMKSKLRHKEHSHTYQTWKSQQLKTKFWCYCIIQINPNAYFSLNPLLYCTVYLKLRRTRMEGLTCLCLVPRQEDVLCCSSYSTDHTHERDFLCKLLLPFSWWSKSCTPACHSACSDGAC